MQYVECIHCRKRYAANQKFRDAIGRKVRCSACGKAFPIVVYHAKPEAADSAGRIEAFEEA